MILNMECECSVLVLETTQKLFIADLIMVTSQEYFSKQEYSL